MDEERLKMPPARDCKFYQRRKHDKWREVEAPELEAPVIDTHAHLHMLPDPSWELVRCAVNGVYALCMIVDPSEDGDRPFDELEKWERDAAAQLNVGGCQVFALPPRVRIAVGVHPHNARLYSDEIENKLAARLADERVAALGEIGLDYHYDLSPRDVQRSVFRRQIVLAKENGLPIALHLRGGEDPVADNAHAEAFAILEEEGFPEAGTLLHCCALGPEEIRPWIDAGCFIAYGGALTFKNAEAAREGARLVPEEQLLLETDSPYMTPEPMRGAACTPAHVVFTAERLAEVRGIQPGDERRDFFQRLNENAETFFASRIPLLARPVACPCSYSAPPAPRSRAASSSLRIIDKEAR